MTSLRPHHALALLPALGILFGVPFANKVHAYVLGLPFLLFWIVCCVLLTSVVMAAVGTLDRRAERRSVTPPIDAERSAAPDAPVAAAGRTEREDAS